MSSSNETTDNAEPKSDAAARIEAVGAAIESALRQFKCVINPVFIFDNLAGGKGHLRITTLEAFEEERQLMVNRYRAVSMATVSRD